MTDVNSSYSAHLVPYACNDTKSSGRRHDESHPTYRNEYQRDRDRIIHSAAFRRLEYKTQVFVNHEGDLFRTRLTHSIPAKYLGAFSIQHMSIVARLYLMKLWS